MRGGGFDGLLPGRKAGCIAIGFGTACIGGPPPVLDVVSIAMAKTDGWGAEAVASKQNLQLSSIQKHVQTYKGFLYEPQHGG